ncbi:MAG: hypothetical protein CFH06_01939, partial [Alphaproteobacteria bacterium MarineAlpha3_Bin5]
MKKYENKKLFTTNIKYLSKSHPQFLTIFDSVNLTTNLVIDDNGEYDIDVGAGQLLYGNNSKGAAERQVQNYMDCNSTKFFTYLTQKQLDINYNEFGSQKWDNG